VWFHALDLGSRERGGRTRPQKGESQHNTTTTLVLHVCASQSRFQPITRDLGSCRKMPGFALSRRQRGFESRWGHKINVPLNEGRSWLTCRRLILHVIESQGSPRMQLTSTERRCGRRRRSAPRGRKLGFPVDVCERTPACTCAGVFAALALPRGAAELGHLQDHYHQNDNDQDPDDDSDNSSVHFASSIRVRPATSGPSCGKRVPHVGLVSLHPQLNHPKGGCITPLRRLKSGLWMLR
jgi:hypothetical protein